MDNSPRITPVTLHDVAREAGVSLATASRALNGSERKVHESYRSRVLDAAARLNYTPNLSAQAVAKGGTNTVALLVADIADPYFSSIAAGVVRASEEAGLVVTMAVTERSPDRELELVRALRGQRPRVMVLAGSRSSEETNPGALIAELQAFESTGGRVVFVSQHELPFETVSIENAEGARQLARDLVRLGYRTFAAITGPPALLTARDRVTGFLDGLAESGIQIEEDRIIATEFTRDGGFAGAQTLLSRGLADIELIFAVSDVMAVGALSALREAGIVPGEDVAVAGFDDIPTVRDVTPPLSTVNIPLVEVGRRAIALALSTDATANDTIKTTVVLRDSTPSR